jgi:flagellar motor switch protein FliN/FliY
MTFNHDDKNKNNDINLDEFQETSHSQHDNTTIGMALHKSGSSGPTADELNAVYDVPVHISAVLGNAKMPVNQLLKLGRGAVIELDRRVGEAIDIYVNERLIARGEVVVVDDRLGITMTEIIKTQ